ncbi:unnamed protein product [Arabidopsis halleri]
MHITFKELAHNHIHESEILEIMCLECISLYVDVMPQVMAAHYLTHLEKFLEAKSCVASTYATICITKILLEKKHGTFRVNPALLLHHIFESLRATKDNDFRIYLMVELKTSPLSIKYIYAITSIVSADPWVKVNEPASLVKSVQAILHKDPQVGEIRWNKLFERLAGFLSSPKAFHEEGYHGLRLLVGNLTYKEINPYMMQVWGASSSRAAGMGFERSERHKLQICLGEDVEIPHMNTVKGKTSVKLDVVAAIRLILEELHNFCNAYKVEVKLPNVGEKKKTRRKKKGQDS